MSRICVRDLLETSYIKNISRVVGGKNGLDKTVSWVHVLEIRDVTKYCVDGGEMILTTGANLLKFEDAQKFMLDLIDSNVTALCMETALYLHKIDERLIKIADEHDFPLIEITEISRFRDISKGLNSMIIKEESQVYDRADVYEDTINNSGSIGTIEDGIRYTADFLDIEVAYIPARGASFITSQAMNDVIAENTELLKKFELNNELYCKGRIAIRNLIINERNMGYLIFRSSHDSITEFERIILGRLSNKVKDNLYQELNNKEALLYEENKWILDWMRGEINYRDVKQHLHFIGAVEAYNGFCVCTTPITETVSFNEFIVHMGITVRKIFEDYSFFVLGYPEEKSISFLVLDRGDNDDIKIRMCNVIDELRKLNKSTINYSENVFCIGKVVDRWEDIKRSYETSLEFLDNNEVAKNGVVVYDNLYVDRLLASMVHTNMFEEYIDDHLGRLVLPENEELLNTLDMYYRCNCSKQKTAEHLHIVRQTLYFRLQKLEEMLGKGFDEGERRLALELALKGYFFGKSE